MAILVRSNPWLVIIFKTIYIIWLPVSVPFENGRILADHTEDLFSVRALGCEYEKHLVFVLSQVRLCRCSGHICIMFFEMYFLKIILQRVLLNLEIWAGNTLECNLEKWKLINLSYTLTSLKRALFFSFFLFFIQLIPSFLAAFWYLMLFRGVGPFVRVEPCRVLICGTIIKWDILIYHDGKLETHLETPTI